MSTLFRKLEKFISGIPGWSTLSNTTILNGIEYMNCMKIRDFGIVILIGGDKDSQYLDDGYQVYTIPYTTDKEVIKRVKSILSQQVATHE